MKKTALSVLMSPLAFIACTQVASATVIEVTKTPTCGCCTEWVEHMREAGFTVKVVDVPDVTPVADGLGVPRDLRSCHTAKVEGYAIEGHVPAGDVQRLLKERPQAVGLAVPGMPLGSPGMEVPGRSDRYPVILISESGEHSIYAVHGGSATAHTH